MRKIVRLGGLFIGSALLAFALFAPVRANAGSARTIAGPTCRMVANGSNSDFYCPLVQESTTYTMSAFSGAYFDFFCPGSGVNVTKILNKYSLSGSYYSDSAVRSCTGFAAFDDWVTASNVKTNASVWDYLWATTVNTQTVYGVAGVWGP